MEKSKKIELLSPAKNKECAIAAIDCGADAIYMGSPCFGARMNASNSLEDIKDVVDYAHKFNVKVYVTLNTILSDKELKEALKLIQKLYEIKVDALIVQDMGLLECDLPPIKFFASTQCHNASLKKIKFLEQTGFSRVILARELSLQQIRKIAKNTNIEIETFIHGALCVSYSGQCYLSQAIGGRSANRGECAQPCRKKYSFEDSKGKVIAKDSHLLCLKDLNLSSNIKDLIDAGVTSFKIEGRLKDIDYIKNVISFYRKKIDEAIENTDFKKSSSGKSRVDFESIIDATFNRGYCEYFLNGRKNDITSFDTPKSKGEFVGTVVEINNKFFRLNSDILKNGDGICFFDQNNELQGTNINKNEKGKVFAQSLKGLQKGTKVFRNFNKEFLSKLENTKIRRKIEVKIRFDEDEKSYKISAQDEDGIEESIYLEKTYEKAKDVDSAQKNIIKNLSKSADSIFEIKDVNLNLSALPFLSLSELNATRRELLSKLEKKRLESFKVEKGTSIQIVPYFEKEIDFKANVMNEKAKLFYEKRGAKLKEYALEKTNAIKDKTLMVTKHCLKYSFGMCTKLKNDKKYNEPLYLKDSYGKRYKLIFNCKDCNMQIQYTSGLFED